MCISLVHVDQNLNVCPKKIVDPAGKEFSALSVIRSLRPPATMTHFISIGSPEGDESIHFISLYGSTLWDLREWPMYSSSTWRCVLHLKP
jgi:hypothetical protein